MTTYVGDAFDSWITLVYRLSVQSWPHQVGCIQWYERGLHKATSRLLCRHVNEENIKKYIIKRFSKTKNTIRLLQFFWKLILI